MIKKIDYSKIFLKQIKKSPTKIKISFRNKLVVFLKNKMDRVLNNHGLTGEFKGKRSINVTGDWRAIYFEDDKSIKFVLFGTHSQLYK